MPEADQSNDSRVTRRFRQWCRVSFWENFFERGQECGWLDLRRGCLSDAIGDARITINQPDDIWLNRRKSGCACSLSVGNYWRRSIIGGAFGRGKLLELAPSASRSFFSVFKHFFPSCCDFFLLFCRLAHSSSDESPRVATQTRPQRAYQAASLFWNRHSDKCRLLTDCSSSTMALAPRALATAENNYLVSGKDCRRSWRDELMHKNWRAAKFRLESGEAGRFSRFFCSFKKVFIALFSSWLLQRLKFLDFSLWSEPEISFPTGERGHRNHGREGDSDEISKGSVAVSYAPRSRAEAQEILNSLDFEWSEQFSSSREEEKLVEALATRY